MTWKSPPITASRNVFATIITGSAAAALPTVLAARASALTSTTPLPKDQRPEKIYGCEVWRKLDWLLAEDKEMLKVDNYPHLISALLAVFDSQISGGKRYDLAEEGLRRANATYFDSHTTDDTSLLTFAMDLTPLIKDDSLSVEDFTLNFIDRLKNDVRDRIRRFQ